MPPTTNSDSEDDLDYVPPADDTDSDAADEYNERDVAEPAPLLDAAEQKKQRDSLWASFQASASAPPTNGTGNGAPLPVKRVKIEKTYLFAGKHVTEVVEVAEDSEEAKKWPRWSPHPPAPPTSESTQTSTPSSDKGDGEAHAKDEEGSLIPPPPVDPSPAASTISSTPGVKRPGPRKPRTVLPSIPKASHAKKISTLDKSAMDWRAHVASQSSDVKDELDANRRGGGYLEKVAFLERVEDRREDAFEASKASKRRKT